MVGGNIMSTDKIEGISIALVENSMDSIEKGLESLVSQRESEYKYAILHLYSGILLFFKDVLYKEHWSLVFQDIAKANKKNLSDGDFKSVNFHTLFQRLKNIGSISLTKNLMSDLEWLRKQRNKIEHLHNIINPNEVKSRISSLLINILITINEHKSSLGYVEDDYVENYNYEYIEFINLFHLYSLNFDEFIKKRNKMISTDLRESYLKITCPICSQIAMELNPTNDFVYCHFCMTKSTIASFLTVYLPDFLEIVHEGNSKYFCPNCHGVSIFTYDNKEICFECFETYEINTLDNCSKCGSTYEVGSQDYLDVCENCIEYMLQNELILT